MCTRATRKKKLVNRDIKTYTEIERPAVCLVIWWCFVIGRLWRRPKSYIPSTLNTDYLLWHTQLIVCAVKY